MPQQQVTEQNPAPTAIERVFDDNGNTIYEGAPEDAPDAGASEPEPNDDTAQAEAPKAVKFRIGDQEFDTREAAIAFAEDTARSANAQQHLLQTLQQPAPQQQQVVTPQQPPALPEDFFTKPNEHLAQRDAAVEQRVLGAVNRQLQNSQNSDAIWREFTDRHPEMSDFRADVEAFTQGNLSSVQGIIGTKGRGAGFDYIATKLKADWSRKADMLKPKRELSNGTQARTPGQRAAGVTAEPAAKKPLTFSEQINSIRKRGRAKT